MGAAVARLPFERSPGSTTVGNPDGVGQADALVSEVDSGSKSPFLMC